MNLARRFDGSLFDLWGLPPVKLRFAVVLEFDIDAGLRVRCRAGGRRGADEEGGLLPSDVVAAFEIVAAVPPILINDIAAKLLAPLAPLPLPPLLPPRLLELLLSLLSATSGTLFPPALADLFLPLFELLLLPFAPGLGTEVDAVGSIKFEAVVADIALALLLYLYMLMIDRHFPISSVNRSTLLP